MTPPSRTGPLATDPTGMSVISLFCGVGGLDLGFETAGFHVVAAADKESVAVRSYNLNARTKVARQLDVTDEGAVARMVSELRGTGVAPRGVIGGPPCQGFSNGNVVKRPDDPRNQLPLTYARILGELRVEHGIDFFVFENVSGLLKKGQRARFQAIHAAFEQAGFHVFAHELDAAEFGVPQRRRRLFLVGFSRDDFDADCFAFPKAAVKTPLTVKDAIGGLPEPAYCSPRPAPETFPHHKNHWTMKPKSKRFESGNFNRWRSFRKLSWSEPSPTVAYGNREIHVHPDGKRRLSIHEAMLLQGFPPEFELEGNFCEQVTQVCNAVPPGVAEHLAAAVAAALSKRRTERAHPEVEPSKDDSQAPAA